MTERSVCDHALESALGRREAGHIHPRTTHVHKWGPSNRCSPSLSLPPIKSLTCCPSCSIIAPLHPPTSHRPPPARNAPRPNVDPVMNPISVPAMVLREIRFSAAGSVIDSHVPPGRRDTEWTPGLRIGSAAPCLDPAFASPRSRHGRSSSPRPIGS